MKVTKYEHACLDITTDDSRIVIDPGAFSSSLSNYDSVSALVITHVHADHFDEATVDTIVAANPQVQIFTTQEVADKITKHPVTIPETSRVYEIDGSSLEFFGENHAEIDPQTPVVQNISVLVNNRLFYPGDSFIECPKPFAVLAVPSSAPWLRVGEVLPLIENSQCQIVFPTHNALLSDVGQDVTNTWLQKFAERNNKEFKYLLPGDSIEI